MMRRWVSWWMLSCALALVAAAQQPGSEVRQCSICHGKREFKKVEPDGSVRALFVDERQLHQSVHSKWHCLDCHADITAIPHPPQLEKVKCQRCHFPGNPVGAPEEVNYQGYVESVHGRLQRAGNPRAPLCQDCHGSHEIRKASDPQSRVFRSHVPLTCGRCHQGILDIYRPSVHGQALLGKQNLDAPSCTDCHGEHEILPKKEKASEVSASHIPETCGRCHGSLEFNQKYEIPINPVKTFKHSFHGIANELGSVKVANCASCHTSHAVLPPSDPASSVNPENIPKTCGKEGCHPGANVNYARGRFHIDPSQREAGLVYWVALFFKYLTAGTLAALFLHILLDLRAKLRKRTAHE